MSCFDFKFARKKRSYTYSLPSSQASSGSLGRGESLDRGGLPGRGGPPGRGSSGHSLGPKRQCLKGGRGYKGI